VIEFLPLGLLVAIPVGIGGLLIARRRRRLGSVWGLSSWVLASLWIAGAAALPSMAGGDRAAAMPIVMLTLGCFLVQLMLFLYLFTADVPGREPGPATRRRIVILLAVMGVILALSFVFACVL
jgi:hypothetical protein